MQTWEEYETKQAEKSIRKQRFYSGLTMDDLRNGDSVWLVFVVSKAGRLERLPAQIKQKLEKKVWVEFRRGDTFYMGKYYPYQLEKRGKQ